MLAHQLADALEREIKGEIGDRLDEPEGSQTVTMSVTLVREIIQALRGED